MPEWKAMRLREAAPGQTEPGHKELMGREPEPESAGAVPGKLPVIPEEVMVLKQFSSQRLDMLLAGLRRAGVPRIALKAVLTEHNSDWTFYHLYQELKEEHETMTAGQQP